MGNHILISISSLISSCIFYLLGLIMAWVNLPPTLVPWLKPQRFFNSSVPCAGSPWPSIVDLMVPLITGTKAISGLVTK